LWEFCRDAAVVLVNLDGRTEQYPVSDLLPRAFDDSFLS
jgi:cytidine deaminase